MELWELVRYLHLLALAVFVGGQILLVVAIVPVLRDQREELMLSVARRFGVASAVAIGVLLVTGIAMASHFSRWQDETLQAKLAVLVVVAVLTGLHIATPRSRGISISLVASSLLVVWLGVAMTH
jgi:putative copper export protein